MENDIVVDTVVVRVAALLHGHSHKLRRVESDLRGRRLVQRRQILRLLKRLPRQTVALVVAVLFLRIFHHGFQLSYACRVCCR